MKSSDTSAKYSWPSRPQNDDIHDSETCEDEDMVGVICMKGFSGNWRGFGSSARAVEADIKVFGSADEANGEIAGPREFEIWYVRVGGCLEVESRGELR
jgi:hypothetical protein